MKSILRIALALTLVLAPAPLRAAAPTPESLQTFTKGLNQILEIVEPANLANARAFSARIRFTKTAGLPKELTGRELTFACQAPDRLRLSAEVDGKQYSVGRNGQSLWGHAPAKQFGVVGKPGVARFATDPASLDDSHLPPFKLPFPRAQVAMLPLLFEIADTGEIQISGHACRAFRLKPFEHARQGLGLPDCEITLTFRAADLLPIRVGYKDDAKIDAEIEFLDPTFKPADTGQNWDLKPNADDRIETVALSHLTRFLEAAGAGVKQKIPTLGPETGAREILATAGKGRLELRDGTRVLFLSGSPEEMGRQQGILMRAEIHNLVQRIVFGVGVGSSFDKGRWFFGEIEAAQARLMPFMDKRYLREMDAMAFAANLPKEEVRLANFFPELFHCSGFAVFGDATQDGRMYHGRVLDYLKGMGLEQNAVVSVVRPDEGNAWVNIGYAGFTGTVTAMNEKQIAIGEMGGRGEGLWDGKPMAQLMREVMEKADTLEQAVEIMRSSPRTCEYYYVISDAKTKQAVGIAATPDTFQVIRPGESHPQLPHPIKNAVLMSAGDRYEELAKRVKTGYGKIDASAARDLMCRPVAMNSNIHSVLFAPDTLDFWVANADSQNPASHTRYTKYNLREMLNESPVSGGGD